MGKKGIGRKKGIRRQERIGRRGSISLSKPESFALRVFAGVAAVAADLMARRFAEKLWTKSTGRTPPDNPESSDVHWAEAVGWSLLSGMAVSAARVLASRKAAGAWHRVSAQRPAAPAR